MITLNASKFALIAIALAVPCITSASTINVTFGGNTAGGDGVVSSVSGSSTVNFNGDTAPSNYTITPNAGIVQGNVSNVDAAPTNDTSYYLSTGTSSVDINLSAAPATYFGLYWGSIDTYNTIAFTEANGTVDTYTGTQIAAADGISANGTTSAYVNFFDNGSAFTSVKLSSTQFAFESDNHAFVAASATPEPSTWILTAGGLALAGFLFRRRQVRA